MRSAVYYPHTDLLDETVLKRALLLEDHVELIVPYRSYVSDFSRYHRRYQGRRSKSLDALCSEAMEVIGMHHVPTSEEQNAAHDLIEDFVTRKLPDCFYYQSTNPEFTAFEIYPRKFREDTVEMLQQAKMAGSEVHNNDLPVSQYTGLTVMAILADCCAGETKRRITDRGDSYAVITNLLVDPIGRDLSTDEAYDQIVPITLKCIDLENVSLRKLIDFRKRESGNEGASIRDLRHRYVDKIESLVNQVMMSPMSANNTEELERIFEDEMKDDAKMLAQELRIEFKDFAYSKDVIVAGLATLGLVAAHALHPVILPGVIDASGGAVSIGGLLSGNNKYGKARRELLQKHPTAYLYELKGGLRL